MRHSFLKYLSVFFLFAIFATSLYAEVDRKKFTLVIDAGHGGKDAGAVGKFSKEKNINLKVALAFGRLVENNCPDVKVVYTRKTDVFVTLQGRANIANSNNADLFISVHTNSLPKGKIAYGTETYTLGIARADENLAVAKRENSVITYEDNYKQVYHGFDPNKVESYIIFELMQDKHMEQSVEMARCLQQQYVSCAQRRNKGVHQAGFLVLRQSSMPAILTELGFISTPAEERYLNSAEGIRKLSQSLFYGFQNYRRKYDKNCGPLPVLKEEIQLDDPADQKESAQAVPEKAKEESKPEKSVPSSKASAHSTSSKHSQTAPSVPAAGKTASESSRPVFKVQIMTSDRPLKSNDRRFKGIRPVDCYKEKGIYKYTYGSSTNYNEIRRMQKSISGKLKDTFIVAFLNGERMNLSQAIKMSKRK